MLWLETACKAQVDTLAMGREIVIPDEAVRNRTARLYDPDVRALGPLEWDAMLRLLDGEDTRHLTYNIQRQTPDCQWRWRKIVSRDAAQEPGMVRCGICQRSMEKAMSTKMHWRTATMVALVTLAATWGSVHAQEIPVVTGALWTQSSEPVKKAYLIGIANAIQVETAYEGATPPADGQSIVPRLARGLKGQTLDSVRDGLDKWYAANPGKLQRPVIETMWFEMVVPGLAKNK